MVAWPNFPATQAAEHGNLGVSLEISLDEKSRAHLYEAREQILARAKEDPTALKQFETLFDKQYKVNVRQIRQGTIPAFLRSPE